MKISMHSLIMLEKMAVMHLRNVAGALHSPNGILLKANVPKEHVNVVFSWSSRYTTTWLYLEYPSKKQKFSGLLAFLRSDQ